MKISDIKQQVKRPDRYSLFVDGKYSFSLSESGLLASRIRIGQEITADELATLKDTAERDKAYNRALGLVARRQRSEWEVRDYLKRKDYEEPIIQEIVERLYRVNLLDDEAFARMWVENRRLLKASSRRRLTQELRQKHVADDIVQKVLDADTTDERSVLRELVERKRRQSRYQDTQKLMQYLVRQGFNYGDVKDVIDVD